MAGIDMSMSIHNDQYIVRDNVPIFDEHGDFSEEKLAHIVKHNNARIADTGDYCPIVIGHTKSGKEETSQPEIVGYATKFSLGQHGKVNPRKAVLATLHFFKDKWDSVRQFPRRSIELWKDGTIDPISLLGATTPQRSLGLLFSKNNCESPTRYDMDQNIQDILAALDPLIKWCQAQMEADSMPLEEEGEVAPPAQEAAAPVAEEAAPVAPPPPAAPAVAAPVEGAPEQEKEKVRMQRDQAQGELAKFQREHDELKANYADMARKFRRAERERDLIRLDSEGVKFDLADELEAIQDMEPEKYAKHLARMKKNYQRSPLAGGRINIASINDDGLDRTFGREDMDRALSLSKANGCSYEQAVVTIKSGK